MPIIFDLLDIVTFQKNSKNPVFISHTSAVIHAHLFIFKPIFNSQTEFRFVQNI